MSSRRSSSRNRNNSGGSGNARSATAATSSGGSSRSESRRNSVRDRGILLHELNLRSGFPSAQFAQEVLRAYSSDGSTLGRQESTRLIKDYCRVKNISDIWGTLNEFFAVYDIKRNGVITVADLMTASAELVRKAHVEQTLGPDDVNLHYPAPKIYLTSKQYARIMARMESGEVLYFAGTVVLTDRRGEQSSRTLTITDRRVCALKFSGVWSPRAEPCWCFELREIAAVTKSTEYWQLLMHVPSNPEGDLLFESDKHQIEIAGILPRLLRIQKWRAAGHRHRSSMDRLELLELAPQPQQHQHQQRQQENQEELLPPVRRLRAWSGTVTTLRSTRSSSQGGRGSPSLSSPSSPSNRLDSNGQSSRSPQQWRKSGQFDDILPLVENFLLQEPRGWVAPPDVSKLTHGQRLLELRNALILQQIKLRREQENTGTRSRRASLAEAQITAQLGPFPAPRSAPRKFRFSDHDIFKSHSSPYRQFRPKPVKDTGFRLQSPPRRQRLDAAGRKFTDPLGLASQAPPAMQPSMQSSAVAMEVDMPTECTVRDRRAAEDEYQLEQQQRAVALSKAKRWSEPNVQQPLLRRSPPVAVPALLQPSHQQSLIAVGGAISQAQRIHQPHLGRVGGGGGGPGADQAHLLRQPHSLSNQPYFPGRSVVLLRTQSNNSNATLSSRPSSTASSRLMSPVASPDRSRQPSFLHAGGGFGGGPPSAASGPMFFSQGSSQVSSNVHSPALLPQERPPLRAGPYSEVIGGSSGLLSLSSSMDPGMSLGPAAVAAAADELLAPPIRSQVGFPEMEQFDFLNPGGHGYNHHQQHQQQQHQPQPQAYRQPRFVQFDSPQQGQHHQQLLQQRYQQQQQLQQQQLQQRQRNWAWSEERLPLVVSAPSLSVDGSQPPPSAQASPSSASSSSVTVLSRTNSSGGGGQESCAPLNCLTGSGGGSSGSSSVPGSGASTPLRFYGLNNYHHQSHHHRPMSFQPVLQPLLGTPDEDAPPASAAEVLKPQHPPQLSNGALQPQAQTYLFQHQPRLLRSSPPPPAPLGVALARTTAATNPD